MFLLILGGDRERNINQLLPEHTPIGDRTRNLLVLG